MRGKRLGLGLELRVKRCSEFDIVSGPFLGFRV